jgi:CRP-like cAMP-binding protein
MKAPPDLLATAPGNRVLALLEPATLHALAPDMSYDPLAVRQVLLVEGRPVRSVWFPVSGVVSMLACVEVGDRKVEIGTVGREGFVGLPLYLGAKSAPGECFVQVEGAAWRMPARAFMRAIEAHPDLGKALQRYLHVLFVQVSQLTACNQLHSPLERCARWLLMTADRVNGETFHMTQEFLAHMLGERRPTVSRVATQLRRRGLIAYSRGRLTILDRPRLEHVTCACYALVKDSYDTLLPRI